MKIIHIVCVLVLGLTSAGVASACADPPRLGFRRMLSKPSTVFVFQVTSAYHIEKSIGDGISVEYVVGHIRVVDTLRGDAAAFKLIRYGFRSCGAIRMAVGQFYVAATTQAPPLIRLAGTDWALLDLTRDFYDEHRKRSTAVDVLRDHLGGAALPDDFPDGRLEDPLELYPASASP